MIPDDFGIVTFSDGKEKWQQLAGTLVESVLEFTPWRVAHFTIGYEYPSPDPRVLVCPLPTADSFKRICYYKLLAGARSPFTWSLLLDADCFVSPDIAQMVDSTLETVPADHAFPLCSRHPFAFDVGYQGNFLKAMQHLEPTLGKTPTPLMPYVHANFFIPPGARGFLERCWELSRELDAKGVEPIRADETILNWRLAAEGCDRQLDYTFTNFSGNKVRNWLNDGPINVGIANKTRLNGASGGVFHGEKSPALARQKYELVKRKHQGLKPRRFLLRAADPAKLHPRDFGIAAEDTLVLWRNNPWRMPQDELGESLQALPPPLVWLDTNALPCAPIERLPAPPPGHDLAFYGASRYNTRLSRSDHPGWLKVRNLHSFFAVSIGSARALAGVLECVRQGRPADEWTRANFSTLDCYVQEQPLFYMNEPKQLEWTRGISLAP